MSGRAQGTRRWAARSMARSTTSRRRSTERMPARTTGERGSDRPDSPNRSMSSPVSKAICEHRSLGGDERAGGAPVGHHVEEHQCPLREVGEVVAHLLEPTGRAASPEAGVGLVDGDERALDGDLGIAEAHPPASRRARRPRGARRSARGSGRVPRGARRAPRTRSTAAPGGAPPRGWRTRAASGVGMCCWPRAVTGIRARRGRRFPRRPGR